MGTPADAKPDVPSAGRPAAPVPERERSPVPCSLREYLLYFLRLGALGFGGPIALAGHMQQDLVEERRWIGKEDFLQGLALSQLSPGPLAAQIAIYLGWVRAGTAGATLVGVVFVLLSFLMVMALSALYLHYGELPWIRGMFYGIGAAVIAVIVKSAVKLGKMTMGKERLLWLLFAVNAAVTVVSGRELVSVFVASGIVAWLVMAPPRLGRMPRTFALPPIPWLLTGLHGVASTSVLLSVFLYFAGAGVFVFGSGLVIVPFLHGGVVDKYHWLNERQFPDAVAVAMVTPGPVVITVAFIGYLVAGPLGAAAAGLGVFLPCYLFVVLSASRYRRAAGSRILKALVGGVTAAAAGAIAGAAVILGRRAIIDWPTLVIFLAALILHLKVKRIPEPALIVAAGIIGMAMRRFSGA